MASLATANSSSYAAESSCGGENCKKVRWIELHSTSRGRRKRKISPGREKVTHALVAGSAISHEVFEAATSLLRLLLLLPGHVQGGLQLADFARHLPPLGLQTLLRQRGLQEGASNVRQVAVGAPVFLRASKVDQLFTVGAPKNAHFRNEVSERRKG